MVIRNRFEESVYFITNTVVYCVDIFSMSIYKHKVNLPHPP